MRPGDAEAVAELHRQGIPTGVLAELGLPALARLYRALVASPDSFVFVGVDGHDRVVAFVSGVTDVGRMYRRVIRRQFWSFAALGLRYALRPRMVRRLLNTLFYPAKVAGAYPRAELLSIVVAPGAQGSGVGTRLLDALLGEFRQRGVPQIKVMVRADFARANGYYRKHGFTRAGQITSHGFPANVYLRDTQPREAP
jgi:ribosomal protein S18 acetylase RimI-like enzyme